MEIDRRQAMKTLAVAPFIPSVLCGKEESWPAESTKTGILQPQNEKFIVLPGQAYLFNVDGVDLCVRSYQSKLDVNVWKNLNPPIDIFDDADKEKYLYKVCYESKSRNKIANAISDHYCHGIFHHGNNSAKWGIECVFDLGNKMTKLLKDEKISRVIWCDSLYNSETLHVPPRIASLHP